MKLHTYDGMKANNLCLKFGIEGGLEGACRGIFEISDDSTIQTLVHILNQIGLTV